MLGALEFAGRRREARESAELAAAGPTTATVLDGTSTEGAEDVPAWITGTRRVVPRDLDPFAGGFPVPPLPGQRIVARTPALAGVGSATRSPGAAPGETPGLSAELSSSDEE